MRAIIIAASIVAMTTSAQAQTYQEMLGSVSTSIPVAVPSCVEQFKGVPALAARLHVKSGTSDGFTIRMCDGRTYDVMAIISAVLDRLDKAERRK